MIVFAKKNFLSAYNLLILLIFTALLSSCFFDDNQAFTTSPNSIILFIGDGMGPEQRKAAQWYSVGMSNILKMDAVDYEGASITAAANSDITGSAAAATAIATGIKTNNGVVGMDPSYNSLVKSILPILSIIDSLVLFF